MVVERNMNALREYHDRCKVVEAQRKSDPNTKVVMDFTLLIINFLTLICSRYHIILLHQRCPAKKEPEHAIIVCHCHQVSCYLQERALTCPIQCRDPEGNRYPIETNESGIRKCSCPYCQCICKAVYNVDGVSDIKLAQVLQSHTLNKVNIVTPHASKLNESTAFVQNLLKRHVEDAGLSSNAQNLFPIKSKVSKVEEFAYDSVATKLAPVMHEHQAYVENFRSNIQQQMIPGVSTFITRNGKKEDIRAIHNGNLWHHRRNNNNLDDNIISNIEISAA